MCPTDENMGDEASPPPLTDDQWDELREAGNKHLAQLQLTMLPPENSYFFEAFHSPQSGKRGLSLRSLSEAIVEFPAYPTKQEMLAALREFITKIEALPE